MKKYTALSYCIFTGSNYMGCKSTARFEQDMILENTDKCMEINSMHLAHNEKDLKIVGPSEHEVPEFRAALKAKNYDYFYGNPNCSGLSSINRQSSCENEKNQYMYKFFELVEDIKPKTFFLENAPALTGAKGFPILKDMANRLFKDYTFTICRDFGKLHNVCMNRQRSFIIGYRKDVFGSKATIELPNKNTPTPNVYDVIKGVNSEEDLKQVEQGYYLSLNNFVTEHYDKFMKSATAIDRHKPVMSLMVFSDKRNKRSSEDCITERWDWESLITASTVLSENEKTISCIDSISVLQCSGD